MAIDYLTKPLARITEEICLQFFKEHVVYCFSILMIMVADNGHQFMGHKFERFLQELNIQHRRTFVDHPQANGQVEVTNRTLLNGANWKMLKVGGPESFYVSYRLIEPPIGQPRVKHPLN